MSRNSTEHLSLGMRCDKGQNVARHDGSVETRVKSHGGKIEGCEISDYPPWARVVECGSGNELWVGVDAHDLVTTLMQDGTNSAWSAACVQDQGPRMDHGINQPGFAGQVHAFGRHPAKAFDIPLRVTFSRFCRPSGRNIHPSTLARSNPS